MDNTAPGDDDRLRPGAPRSRSARSATFTLLQQRARRDVRVLARTARRSASCAGRRDRVQPRGRRVHAPGPRGRPVRQRRRDAGDLQLRGARRAGHDDQLGARADRRSTRPRRSCSPPTRPARPTSARSTARRSPRASRRKTYTDLTLARAHLRGPGDEPVRLRRGRARDPHVDDRGAARHDRARDDDRLRPGRHAPAAASRRSRSPAATT